jgi:hypothetical protein
MLESKLIAGGKVGARPWQIGELADDGVWGFFGAPKAIWHRGYIYFTYVRTNGDSCVRAYHLASNTLGPENVLHGALDVDDHAMASLLVLPSGHLGSWYARHEPIATTMHQKISAETLEDDPLLIAGFDAEVDTDADMGSFSYDYPDPIILSIDPDRIRMHYRNIPNHPSGSDYQLTQSESIDEGDIWSGRDPISRTNVASGRQYWQMVSDGISKIHYFVSNESPNTGVSSIAHFYFDAELDGYFRSDGSGPIAQRGTPPLDVMWFEDFTIVHAATNTTRGWVWDGALEPDGTPVLVGVVFDGYDGSGVASDHRYYYWRWNADTEDWDATEIVAAGAGIDVTGVYSPGICVDHNDPSIVWACVWDGSQPELFRYTTDDHGATFAEEQITSGSSAKHIRPITVEGAPAVVGVLVVFGVYTGYTAFDTAIQIVRR